ncbi:putative xyloglucan endotransglucosylase/hydrolase protein 32 [Dichanthelium oligosanthes]|uniref:Putative xyloglucan endotransglucosylase/hydrolase protein 32 n=1 Tax=Dichanthelium oligosanthes TaxID=888268 RepID=A0A1E5WFD6_9POAL|nr:putative xyloglucan endotransglucosylase/hydrolase protein 32 [Dichanthelium oligosanthes]
MAMAASAPACTAIARHALLLLLPRSRRRGSTRASGSVRGPSTATSAYNVTIWLDSTSGSGFKSRRAFRSGYFGASVKLQPGYTAGVITAFYLLGRVAHCSCPTASLTLEFLGTTPGRPCTLQTNVYIRGSSGGDGGPGRVVGREVKFHLDWFDPTADFHPLEPHAHHKAMSSSIRRYPLSSAATFPRRPMWVYGSIWDDASWATGDGRYRADYRYSPFVARGTI